MTLSPEHEHKDAAAMLRASRTHPAQWLFWGIPLLSCAALVILVFRYAVAVPVLDQWALVSLLDKWHGHNLTFADFWAQHNEHRLVFPRLIMLACAVLSGWDLRWELAVNLLLGVGIYAALTTQIRQTAQRTGILAFRWLAPVFALAIFSFRQHENWEWGWQLQIFLNVLAVIVGIVALAKWPLSWLRLGVGMACGIVATYSFANGMLFWLVGGCLVLCLPRSPRKWPYLILWVLVGSAVIASYRYQFADNPIMRESLAYGLRHPVTFLLYAVTYVGSLFSIGNLEAHPYWSMAFAATPAGLFGLAALWRVARNCRLQGVSRDLWLPYGAMVFYASLSALVSASGRVSMGVVQSTASRYTTISQLFWVGLVGLALLATELRNAGIDSRASADLEEKRRANPSAGAASTAHPAAPEHTGNTPHGDALSLTGRRMLIAVGIVLACFSAASMPRLKRHYEAVGEAERELRNNSAHPIHLHELHPNDAYLRQQQAILQGLRLNIYEESAPK